MKEVLKKVLTPQQWNRLRNLKNNIVHVETKAFSKMINLFPEAVRVFLKSEVNVVKKIDYEKEDLFMDVSSSMEYKVRLNSCEKEPETINWIENFFNEEDTFFDIGANIGVYSLVAAKRLKRKRSIYAFEPSFLNFNQLNKNILINNFQDVIIPLNIALSKTTMIDSFNYHNLVTGGALHAFGEAIDYRQNNFNPVFRPAAISFSIDDFIEKFDVPAPNHIKLDVDGIEMSILEGAHKTISSPNVKSILLEINGNGKDVIDYLKERGFRIHSCFYHIPLELHLCNYIFTKL